MVVGVAGDMKPGAGINQRRVPALQHVGGVRKPASQSMQSISWTQKPLATMKHNPRKFIEIEIWNSESAYSFP
jgi:hypothetical protein